MLQLIASLLCVYTGLSISFEQLSRRFFNLSQKDLTEIQEAKLGKIIRWFEKTERITGVISFIVGIIIFIAPTPTSQVVDTPVPHIQQMTQRFIGDLFPSIILILSGIILNQSILHFFNFQNASRVQKFESFISRYSFWIGILAMFFGILHLFLGTSILF